MEQFSAITTEMEYKYAKDLITKMVKAFLDSQIDSFKTEEDNNKYLLRKNNFLNSLEGHEIWHGICQQFKIYRNLAVLCQGDSKDPQEYLRETAMTLIYKFMDKINSEYLKDMICDNKKE